MLEFILQYSKGNRFKEFPIFKFMEAESHFAGNFSENSFRIKYLSFLNQSDDRAGDLLFEIFIYGSIYYPVESSTVGKITAKNLLENMHYLSDPLKFLRGNYSILIYDKIHNSVFLKNDPLGLKPIYYGQIDNNIYISSSLTLLSKISKDISSIGVFEKLVFGYNINETTIFTNFKYLGNGYELFISDNNLTVKKYFDISEISLRVDDQKFNLVDLIDRFNLIVKQRTENLGKIFVTLTGGNDGRAVLSAVHKVGRNYETVSFGMPNGENTIIPEMISKKLGFKHNSIYLNDHFLDSYIQNALDTIELSDGNLSFEQQSTLYCYRRIKVPQDSVLLTGLIAGEILGPIHLRHDYFNQIYFDLIYNNQNITKEYLFNFISFKEFIQQQFMDNFIEEFCSKLIERKNLINEIKKSSKPHLYYYLDLIELGFRKFYGSQMHLIRYQVENIPVFYDLDILELVLQSNFNLVFKNSFSNLFKRRNSRIPQSFITKTNYPELAKLQLDRGFTPADLIHPLKKYIIWFPYFYRKYFVKKMHKDFDSPNWCKTLLNEIFRNEVSDSEIFNKNQILEYVNRLNINNSFYSSERSKIISDYLFIHKILK